MIKILNIIGIKTPQGIFISNFNGKERNYKYANLNGYKVNNETPKLSFDSNWNIVNEEPKIITISQPPLKENYRYALKDISMASDKIPAELSREEANYVEDYEWVWKDEYAHLISLYKLEYDEIEQPDKEIEFVYQQIVEVDGLKNIKDFDWEIYKTEWIHKGTQNVSIENFKFQLIDKIMFPKLYYQQYCPVTLPSKTFYDIIRYYIKNNINPIVAEITSDYDFCFTVKKKVKRIEPLVVKKEQLKSNGRSYAKPKFTTKVHQYAGSFVIFEMTHKDKCYNNYPVLPDIIGDNIDELQKKIDNILHKLIEFINKPVTICECCNGTGISQEVDKYDLNELINN